VPELISLTVLAGEAHEIESTGLVHLKPDKSLCHITQMGYRSKPASRHEPGDEDVAAPRLELELGAGRLKLHDKRIAFQRHRRLAEARIDEIAGQRCERRERQRLGRLGKQLRRRLVFASLSEFATVSGQSKPATNGRN